MNIVNRAQVTELVVMARIKKGLSWAKVAKAVGQSKEWTTAALLGQMQMTKRSSAPVSKRLPSDWDMGAQARNAAAVKVRLREIIQSGSVNFRLVLFMEGLRI